MLKYFFLPYNLDIIVVLDKIFVKLKLHFTVYLQLLPVDYIILYFMKYKLDFRILHFIMTSIFNCYYET